MKKIDLKKTIDNAKITQVKLAKDFDYSPQHIQKYYKTNKMSKGQNIAFIQYFTAKEIYIYYII